MATKQKKPPVVLTEYERDLIATKQIRNKIFSQLNFGQLANWREVYLLAGLSSGEIDYAYITASPPLDYSTRSYDTVKMQLEYEQAQRLKTKPTREGLNHYCDCLLLWVEQRESQRQYDIRNRWEGSNGGGVCESLDTELVSARDQQTNIRSSNYTEDKEHPLQKAKLWKKQKEAATKLWSGIVERNKKGQLLQAGTGSGKTFALGELVRHLVDEGFVEKHKCMAPWPIIYVTKASIVSQTERVLRTQFGLDTINDIRVINIEMLRATFGEMFIKWETKIEGGECTEYPRWKKGVHPLLVIWDECHILMNEGSQQSMIAQSLNDVEDAYGMPVYQVFSSATPFMRVSGAKCFSVATRCAIEYGGRESVPLDNHKWSAFARAVANPSDPKDYCTAAISRLMTYLLPYIVDIKGLRPQFHPKNRVKLIDFDNREQAEQYAKAIEDYQKKKAALESNDTMSASMARMCILAEFTILRKKAELIRAPYIARRMFQQVKDGKAAVAACCFKDTISTVVKLLIEEHRVPRSLISLIWGGAVTKKKVKKAKTEVMSAQQTNALMQKMIESGLDAELAAELLGAQTVSVTEEASDETKSEIAKYKLGNQSAKQRQEEIDRFQSGKSLYCIFTFKAGGVGLSLHHTDELVGFKCRKKPDSDWVEAEDIAKVPVRPRAVTLTPVFSGPELVQGLGRCPRLTSLSDTEQDMIFYNGTIEVMVASSVGVKLKCLKKVVRNRESWEDMITGGSARVEQEGHAKDSLMVEVVEELKDNVKERTPEDDEDDVFLSDSDDGDED